MNIIPVIDILGGVAVHAEKGIRSQYRPLKSILCPKPDPLEVALAFKNLFPFKEIYVADLDAITGVGENLQTVSKIARRWGEGLMVDCGISDVAKIPDLLTAGVTRIVVGTETLENLNTVRSLVDVEGVKEVLGSIDIVGGRILSKCGELESLRADQAANKFASLGISRLIVLDISRVGSLSGLDYELLDSVVKSVSIPIVAGGGVRDIHDIERLGEIGVSGVLVSTALHSGRISKEDLNAITGVDEESL